MRAQGKELPVKSRGRRLAPAQMDESASVMRSSPQGEISFASDLVGQAVKLWFQQARRLQSLVHALCKLTGLRQDESAWAAIVNRPIAFLSGIFPSNPMAMTANRL